MLRINNIKIRTNISNEKVFEIAIKKHKINPNDILEWHISKKSIDARDKNDVHYIYCIDIQVKNEKKYRHLDKVKKVEFSNLNLTKSKLDLLHSVSITKDIQIRNLQSKNLDNKKIVIVGAGPAGLFSALTLVNNGFRPIIIEQGKSVEQRKKDIEFFQKTGILNTSSNVQFGEGGAGTFSDGKLTTGINSPFCRIVLEEFVKFGAPEEILYLSKPHIGTDNLITIIKNMREYIISKGGSFLFNTKVIDFDIKDNTIKGVLVKNIASPLYSNNNINDNSKSKNISENFIEADVVVLAIGHSSRDTFKKIYEKGFNIEKKNFSVGVRIEHLQEDINKAQYGTITKLKLPPAEYKLAYHSSSGRSCYTFCMCPRWICYGFF